ncbi:hypothetical protein BEWA_048320 [Theileria equi strain WA]|uniref:Uncharacterized protein n=1 Tax=Theileria equi strain WA TaxID=1537102 RepID=L1LAR1_THEEQ|nr:hypothetical protein BEWA_048320 [Theileria equi strain WA]EKX72365.1 hypothetical protein BEWA_048320 [Theileria equi strain WA]|eukprot:XP_004831817.1 hypothetical protein BEWA_048320 [Theileria equi strain WA]
MNGVLTLSVENQCDDKTCSCVKSSPDPGIIAEKKPNTPVTGFTKCTHHLKSGGTFTLSGILNNGNQIRRGGTIRNSIDGVESVSVYYWNGNDKEPILLGVTTGGGSGTTTRYCRIKGNTLWGNGQVEGLTELEALDQQNCHNNNAVVFNLQNPTNPSMFYHTGNVSYCTRVTRNITESTLGQGSTPPGSDYTTRLYTIKDGDLNTKVSRVTYNGEPTDIPPINFPVDMIALYSYPSAINVPLMLEFKSTSNGTSRWFYSTNLNGTKWLETSGNSFYDSSGTIPQSSLSEKLDEVLCSQYSNVTINLTRTHSEQYAKYVDTGNDSKYCCGTHKGTGRISIISGEIKVNSINKTTSFFKHSISSGNLAGIYYNGGNGSRKRKNIKLHGSQFPISVKAVYAFYCGEDGPSLIHVDSTNSMARGWYKKEVGTEIWRWNSTLSVINSDDIDNGLTCAKWKRLKIVLTGCNCGSLQDCSDNSGTRDSEEKQLQQQEEEEIRKREGGTTALPAGAPGTPSGTNVGSGSSRSGSSSISYSQSSSQPPPEVTIDINNRSAIGQSIYGGNSSNVYVTPNSTTLDGFTESTHKAYGREGNYFAVKEFKYKNKIVEGLKGPMSKVSSVSVFYWTHLETEKHKERNRPLLVKVTQQNPTGGIVNEMHYENISTKPDENTQWKLWKGFPPKQDELRERLTLLNCDINHVVSIKVNQTKGFYCGHLNSHNPGRVNVEGVDEGSLGNYRAFEHKPTSGSTFHISRFTRGTAPIALDGLPTSVLDVKKVLVYFCGRSPLLLYIDSNDPKNAKQKWFKKPDNGTIWESTKGLDGKDEKSYTDIVGILDGLRSSCAPPSAIIDIYKRGTSTKIFYSHDSGSNRVLVTGVRDSPYGFTEYQHTISGRTTFSIKAFQHNGRSIVSDFSENMSKVTRVCVFYWTPLETTVYRDKGRPLLFKVVTQTPGRPTIEIYYENNGDTDNLKWKPWNNGVQDLSKKLHLLNCKLNNAVIVDVSQKSDSGISNYDACETTDNDNLDNYHGERMQVSEDSSTSSLGDYKVYKHILNNGDRRNFHIVNFHNNGVNINKVGSLPILDVEEVKVYFCSLDKKPLLLYYKVGESHNWYKNENPSSTTGLWVSAASKLSNTGSTDYRAIIWVLNTINSPCAPKEPTPAARGLDTGRELTTDSQTEPTEVLSTAKESESPPPKAEARAEARSPAAGTPQTSTFWESYDKSIPTVLTGVGVVSGSLTGFGWWAFKRSRGDPWVRQI